MSNRLRRALSAAAVLAVVAGIAPLVLASPASAIGTLQGAASIKSAGGAAALATGDSGTTFTLRLPSMAACEGDAVAGYRWSTFMVPTSVDPATLSFGPQGPTGAGNRALRTSSGGSPVANRTGLDPGTGTIINIPDMNFSVFSPGDIPTGVYNVGIACTLAGVEGRFWETQMTILKSATGGPAQFVWKAGNVQAAPDAPTLSAATASTDTASAGKVSVSFDVPEAVPAVSGCSLFVGTTPGGSDVSGAAGTSVPCASPQTVTGLAYGQAYFFRLKSANSIGASPASNELSATAVRPAVTALHATPGAAASIAVDWADAPLLAAGEQYNITVAGVAGTFHSSSSNITFNGAPGNTYNFTVTYGAAGTSLPASTSGTAKCNSGPVSGLVSNSLPQLEAVACVVVKLGL